MTHEPSEEKSVADRLRRALQDNPRPEQLSRSGGGVGELDESFLKAAVARHAAVGRNRELRPRLTHQEKRVLELRRRLENVSPDSVHFQAITEELAQAIREYRQMNEQYQETLRSIRDTQWLMDLLAFEEGA